MSEENHVRRTRVALACDRFARELSQGAKDLEAARACMERVAQLPFSEIDDIAGARTLNEATDQVAPLMKSGLGAARRAAEDFEQRCKEISRNPSEE